MAASPAITRDDWGHLDVDGLGRLRDAKLWPGGGRGWDWHETGTHHDPGVQPGDIAELLDHDATSVVIGAGRRHRLGVPDATVEAARSRGATVEVLETSAAIARYAELRAAGVAVGALIHSTC